VSTIVTNQKRAFVSRAISAADRLAVELRNVSPAEQAAILAIVAKNANTPIDIAMIGEPHDWLDARAVLDGHLRCDSTGRWEVGSGCHLQIVELPR
jgi:hypothetical protein